MPRALAFLAVSLLALLPAGPRASPSVKIRDLGALDVGGADSMYMSAATSVNAFGEVAGTSCGFIHCRAFRWTAAAGMEDLGTLGGTDAFARRVTPFGTIVGISALTDMDDFWPFVWTRRGGMVRMSGPLGDGRTLARDANDWGQIVGETRFIGREIHAFSWTPWGGAVDLGTLGGQFSSANAVSDGGQVVGDSTLASEAVTHGFVWTPWTGMLDLGTLGGSRSEADDVNAWGLVVGNSALPGDALTHAFAWTPWGGMVDLGAPREGSSYARAVNDRGQVIGTWAGTDSSHLGGFFWSREDGMIDLGSLGGSTEPWAISPTGQVVGQSFLADDRTHHAFSWTKQGGMIDLGGLSDGSNSVAYDVNVAGAVVGRSTTAAHGEWRPVLWTIGHPAGCR